MNHAALADAIREGIAALDQSVPEDAADRLASLLEELERWNQRMNLTAIRALPDMVSGHVLDSLVVRPHLQGRRIIDIGTGAGFPGLPLAIAEPVRNFELLDSNAKKIGFVTHAIARLGIGNAAAVRSRAEDYAPGKRFDTVIARAVASTAELLTIGSHLLKEGGVLLAMKGKHPAGELGQLPADWESSVTELVIPGLEHHARHLVTVQRKVST